MNRLSVRNYLLPCPFCGGEADVTTDRHPSGCEIKYVYCRSCHCRTDYFYMDDPNGDMVKVWNTRQR